MQERNSDINANYFPMIFFMKTAPEKQKSMWKFSSFNHIMTYRPTAKQQFAKNNSHNKRARDNRISTARQRSHKHGVLYGVRAEAI
jgi:hypothetical protein